ncbi:hypothetical protein AO384_0810 [Moraxella catarrhalis]|uniref:Uncharacterized protein n=1 Tax=Moraxella catarrhalis TaxID=480 RepID=A0A198UT25_MORCA|nr:hypothetical protein AO384_0810 [Moraxella catarrhalis]OAU97493.1 hypothetical protein AO383_0910 [Moraxella catarrhalis]OAU99465.1 hypothetical protein AO382_1951 [Moraxella catarrhalis]
MFKNKQSVDRTNVIIDSSHIPQNISITSNPPPNTIQIGR